MWQSEPLGSRESWEASEGWFRCQQHRAKVGDRPFLFGVQRSELPRSSAAVCQAGRSDAI